jgi:hypothetical protein
MTKFFLYARKSTDEPNGQILSIEVIKKSRRGEARNGTENREYSRVLPELIIIKLSPSFYQI